MKPKLPELCPVCLGEFKRSASGVADFYLVIGCPRCGEFAIHEDVFDPGTLSRPHWTKVKRAALSHALRRRQNFPLSADRPELPFITDDALTAFAASGAELPAPTQQVRNLIAHLGNTERRSGEIVGISDDDYPAFGAVDGDMLTSLLIELQQRGLITQGRYVGEDGYRLTFQGWEEWESLPTTSAKSDYGIIAMSFNSPELTAFVNDCVRPAAKEVGLSLHRIDDPEIVRAGVIDNIMRQTIRDAAFVVADLTHGNNGAYWEAGFAEGLGKPVIYLCEANLWKVERTHFDTNHCTTVVWDKDKPDEFRRMFVATLKNSLAPRR